MVLFSEVNSKLGSPFLDLLADHHQVDLVAVVTSRPGRLCSYFVDDTHQVDLESQGRRREVRVFRPGGVNDGDVVESLRRLAPDYFIVANFQQILKTDLLTVPRITAVNFHPSPLPRYAGLAPFHWMVRNGERHGFVTALEVAAGVDTGDIIMQRETPLTGWETSLQLRATQERANVQMLVELVPKLADGSFTTTPQDLERRSYFGRPNERDYVIDFTDNSADIARVIRAGYRSPGAHAHGADGSSVVILTADLVPGEFREPLAAPGQVRRTGAGVFVAARDEWVRVITVERHGHEVSASRDKLTLPDGLQLTSSMPSNRANDGDKQLTGKLTAASTHHRSLQREE